LSSLAAFPPKISVTAGININCEKFPTPGRGNAKKHPVAIGQSENNYSNLLVTGLERQLRDNAATLRATDSSLLY
jgi:hypothetical protein